MKWIIITTPTFISHEAKYIDQLFEAGIDLLHLRKPDSNSQKNASNCSKRLTRNGILRS